MEASILIYLFCILMLIQYVTINSCWIFLVEHQIQQYTLALIKVKNITLFITFFFKKVRISSIKIKMKGYYLKQVHVIFISQYLVCCILQLHPFCCSCFVSIYYEGKRLLGCCKKKSDDDEKRGIILELTDLYNHTQLMMFYFL